MKLKEFIKLYTGYAGISIEGYCEKEDCVENKPWWSEAGERQVAEFGIIGNYMDVPELRICLKD